MSLPPHPRIAPELMTVMDNPNATRWSVGRGFHIESNGSSLNGSAVYPYHVFKSGFRDSLRFNLNVFLPDKSHKICKR